MIRILRPDDAPALERFLVSRAESSMFLRANSRAGGLVYEGKPLQGVYAGAFRDGEIVSVVAHYWNGNLILQAPERLEELARLAAESREIRGLLGPWDQVSVARKSLKLASPKMDSREDLFALPLGELRVPQPLADGRVVARRATDLERLVRWRVDYLVEALNERRDERTEADARRSIRLLLERREIWELAADVPVSMTAFNATLPDMVQVGGVWTPPEFRGRGYARAAVAASLLDARAAGARTAILFTGQANEPARRAYLSLGFRVVGDYGIVLFPGR